MTREFYIGDRVRLKSAPPYFKTADPMPMLRPPDLMAIGTLGIITEQRLAAYWVVKFDLGTFLIDSAHLERVVADSSEAP